MDSAQTVLGKLLEDMVEQILALEKRVKELHSNFTEIDKRLKKLESYKQQNDSFNSYRGVC